MVVKAWEMVRDVRVVIDMNKGDAPLFMENDTDTLSLDEIIRDKLVDAVRLVEMEAPHSMLEGGHDFCTKAGEHLYLKEDGTGFIVLPSDFMRLVSLRMSDWHRTLFEAITTDDPEYQKQSSRFGGVRGNVEKPVAAIVMRSEGKVLEIYSCKDRTATIEQATYMPYPKIDADGGIDVAEECYRPAVYRAAALTLASVGDPLSTTMMEMSVAAAAR